MAEIIDNLSGYFISTVCGYDKVTREVDVYIPKLMPAISKNRKEVKTLTNIGNASLENLQYNHTIQLASTIKAKPFLYDEPLPDIGSLVLVEFFDNSFKFCYWRKFNPNESYQVIEEERYPRSFYLQVGDKQLTVNKDDIIKIEVPSSFEVILNENKKEKIFRIKDNSDASQRLSSIETAVGTPEQIQKSLGNGKETENLFNATGIFARISKLEEEIQKLKKTTGGN